jgi:hypothetical protein
MPISEPVTVKYAGLNFPELHMSWGIDFPRQRRRSTKQGHGYSIELPAVLDILQAIEDGTATTAQARAMLFKVTDHLYDAWELREYESWEDLLARCERDGDCPDCTRHSAEFDQFLDQTAEQWRRYQTPEMYPFAAGSSNGLHHSTCSVVRRTLPEEWARPVGDDYDEARRHFCHQRNSRHDPDDAIAHLRIVWKIMTAEQARRWQAERVGPKGGRNYRRCAVCAPTP